MTFTLRIIWVVFWDFQQDALDSAGDEMEARGCGGY